jgi:hypothetical protein
MLVALLKMRVILVLSSNCLPGAQDRLWCKEFISFEQRLAGLNKQSGFLFLVIDG